MGISFDSMTKWKSDTSCRGLCKTCGKSWSSGKIHAIARQHAAIEGHEVHVEEKVVHIYTSNKNTEKGDDDE